MGELSPVIEGHVKFRDGKKWKARFARVIRLSPVADCLTLQLWRDGREVEKGLGATKGSINLNDYIGFESSFNLDKEANTLALIFKEMVVLIALESREILMKWQVRLTTQFEEGIQMGVHLVTFPKKAKLSPGPMRIHLQNMKFSLTTGVPPVLVHSWDMVDLRRYGAVEGGRFCFEGGTRCGKGEGLHVFRVDNAEDIQISFDLASKGKLENKKRAGSSGFAISASPSVASNLCQNSDISGSSLTALLNNSTFRSNEELERSRSRSRSRSVNTSFAWSSIDGGLALSSPDTMSLTLSDVEQAPDTRLASPDHLVSRRAVLERIGMAVENGLPPSHNRSQASSRSCGSEDDFYLNWSIDKRQGHPPFRRQGSCQTNSIDRLSLSSGDSSAHSTYDHPKTVLKVTSSPRSLKRNTSAVSGPPLSSRDSVSPSLAAKSLRRAMSERAGSANPSMGQDMRRMIAATPCACSGEQASTVQSQSGPGFENYDIPRNLGRQEAMQFYDTPRNVREAIESSQMNGMGNYDIPTAGPLPVFRKPCGCIMKLTSHGESFEPNQVMTWTCLREGQGGDESSELKIPRVKLTGQGRMPVVDMSKINAMRCLSEPPRDSGCSMESNSLRPLSPNSHSVRGLPPKHPVYAQIDRSRKTCPGCASQGENVPHKCGGRARESDGTNYTNLDFANSLSLYENSKDVLSRIANLPGNRESQVPDSLAIKSPTRENVLLKPFDGQPAENYLNMSPKKVPTSDYELMQCSDKPLIGFSPVNFENLYPLCESIESMALMCDSKFNTIKQMPKNISKICEDSSMSNSCHGDIMNHSGNKIPMDALSFPLVPSSGVFCSGYVTIPRSRVSDNILSNISRSSSIGSTVTMRRSASVPCKRDRDSTSSGGSDSGVSTGSPRQSITDQMEFIK